MGLSDGAFFMIKHNPFPNGNHPISSPICPIGVADTLGTRHFERFTKIVRCIVIPKPYQTLLCPSTSPTYSGNCTFAGIINAINIPPPTVGTSAVRSSENLEGHAII